MRTNPQPAAPQLRPTFPLCNRQYPKITDANLAQLYESLTTQIPRLFPLFRVVI
jgi:hypothetical protein